MDEDSVSIKFGFIRFTSERVVFVLLHHGAYPTAEAKGGGTTNPSQVTTELSSVGLDVGFSIKTCSLQCWVNRVKKDAKPNILATISKFGIWKGLQKCRVV